MALLPRPTNLIRSVEVDGAISGTYETLRMEIGQPLPVRRREQEAHPSRVQILRNSTASSGGRSTMMNPFAPAFLASCTARSSPCARSGLK